MIVRSVVFGREQSKASVSTTNRDARMFALIYTAAHSCCATVHQCYPLLYTCAVGSVIHSPLLCTPCCTHSCTSPWPYCTPSAVHQVMYSHAVLYTQCCTPTAVPPVQYTQCCTSSVVQPVQYTQCCSVRYPARNAKYKA